MKTLVVVMVGGEPEDWGIIPTFLDNDDPRPAAEQFNENYIGGWNPFPGFEFDTITGELLYKGDPPLRPKSAMFFRDERIVLYPHGWVMIIAPDDTWQISRMD